MRRLSFVALLEALLAAQRASSQEQRGIGEAEIEDGDVAERMIEPDEEPRLAAFDATLLANIERALAKLDAGGYGVSEDSSAPIGLARLEAVPWARRTEQEEARHRRQT
jgi:RNA polymerase-binding transcription factor DksA